MPRVIRTSRARRPVAGCGASRALDRGGPSGRAGAGAGIGRRRVRPGAHPRLGAPPPARRPASGGRRRFQRLALAGEVGDHAVDASEREDAPNHGAGGDDQPQLAAVGQGPLVRPHQDAEPGRIAGLGGGHVHYERGAAAGRGFEENRPQPPGVAGIDIRGRRHHGVRKDAEPGFLRLSGLHQGRDGHRVCFGGSPDAGLRRRAVLHRRRARA